MIISVEGEEATGKTTLAYTAPLPIVGFSFDFGSERSIYGTQFDLHFKGLSIDIVKYQKGADTKKLYDGYSGDITIFELPQPVQLDSNKIVGCTEEWDYFIQLYAQALEDSRVQSIVIDTMTLARRLKADAYLQEVQRGKADRKQLLQIEWGHANDSIRNVYTIAAGMNKNLVALHHLTDERKDVPKPNGEIESIVTGNRILEGLSQTYRYVDVAVRMEKVRGQLTGRLNKVGYNLGLEGNVVTDPTWDGIAGLIEMSLGERIKLPKRVVG